MRYNKEELLNHIAWLKKSIDTVTDKDTKQTFKAALLRSEIDLETLESEEQAAK